MSPEFQAWLNSKGFYPCPYDADCPRGREIEGYEDEGLIHMSKKGCIYKVVHDELKTDDTPITSFPETLRLSPYWTLRDCDWKKGQAVVDWTVLTAIKAWSGDALEPSQMEHRTPEKQREIEYNALDLIYKLLEHLEEKPLDMKKRDHGRKWLHFKISKIKDYSEFLAKTQEEK